ncbi:cysteine biosynthesis protein CysZ, partial [Mesorhizobium sp. M7A.F.Ca.CA.004.06.1.1]
MIFDAARTAALELLSPPFRAVFLKT